MPTDPLSYVPSGDKYDVLRATLEILQRDFPDRYSSEISEGRVRGWVHELDQGTRDAMSLRSDIITHIIGAERAQQVYGLSESQFQRLVSGDIELGTASRIANADEGAAEGGTYTTAQVSAWFDAAEQDIALTDEDGNVTETESQRLDRLVMQLNAGTRSESEVLREIYFGAGDTLESGAEGAALLSEVYGGTPEVWFDKSKNQWFLAYGVPGTDVPLLYSLDSNQLKTIFPDSDPIADRSLTSKQIQNLGGIHAGTADDPFGDPYAEFLDMLEKEAQFKPWLKDPDMMAVLFEAALEGREPTQAELATTEWWQNHSAAEREWLTMSTIDPASADAAIKSARIQTRDQLEALGMANPPDQVVNFLADKLVTGTWGESVWTRQLRAIADPQSNIEVDTELQGVVDELDAPLDTTRKNEEKVRQEVMRWLGPAYGQWSDEKVKTWAGKLRNDPDGMEALTTMLRQQRLSLFPEYENPNLTYEDIAGPWKNLWQNTWRQPPDETDNLFLEIVRSNDYEQAGQRLRAEGLNRGIDAVRNDLASAGVGQGQQFRSLR